MSSSTSSSHPSSFYFVTSFFSLISLIISLAILLLYIRNSRLRTFSVNLLFQLAFIDFLHSLNHLFPYAILSSSPFFCTIQGFIEQFTQMASLFMILNIAINTYLAVHGERILHKFAYLYKFTAYIIPFILAILPLMLNSYTLTDLYCWIDPKSSNLRVFFSYIPLLCVYFGIGFLFIQCITMQWRLQWVELNI